MECPKKNGKKIVNNVLFDHSAPDQATPLETWIWVGELKWLKQRSLNRPILFIKTYWNHFDQKLFEGLLWQKHFKRSKPTTGLSKDKIAI